MAPGSSICEEFLDSQLMDCETTIYFDNAHSFKTSTTRNIKTGLSVHELLECPVCSNSMYPPIHQCPDGHTLCSTCKVSGQDHRPTCHRELGNIRCLALEKVTDSLELACRFFNLGCSEKFAYYSKSKHEHLCQFRPYSCPYSGSVCLDTGDVPTL